MSQERWPLALSTLHTPHFVQLRRFWARSLNWTNEERFFFFLSLISQIHNLSMLRKTTTHYEHRSVPVSSNQWSSLPLKLGHKERNFPVWPYLCPASLPRASDLHAPTEGLTQVWMMLSGSIVQVAQLQSAASLNSCSLFIKAPRCFSKRIK